MSVRSDRAVAARTWLQQSAPGVGLVLALALAAKVIAGVLGGWAAGGKLSPISPVLCAVLLGMLWRLGLGVPPRLSEGLQWVSGSLLKIGIALVGLRLTLAGAGEVLALAAPVAGACICAALLAGALLCRLLRTSLQLGILLSVGTAVCGCTAIVALAPVIRARPEETGFALVVVVALGCLGMLLYPSIANHFFAASPTRAGLFLGTSIHDTSQVVGAALIYAQQYLAPDALGAASLTKLLRNLSIAVLIPAAAWLVRSRVAAHEGTGAAERPGSWRSFALPGFVICFVLLVVLRSAGDATFASAAAALHWQRLIGYGQLISELLLISGMTAVGLSVSVKQVAAIGWRPLACGVAIAAIVASCSLILTSLRFTD